MKSFISLLAILLLCVSPMWGQQEDENSNEEEAREDLDYYKESSVRSRNRIDESPLWYGTGAVLNFSSNNSNNFFTIGLSPMLGYKINNFLSIGPRASIAYNSIRFQGFGGSPDTKNRFWTWAGGLFVRGKVFNQFFLQTEYSLISDVDVYTNGDQNRVTRAVPFLGGGYQQGGGAGSPGFEILLLFRLTQSDRLNDSPYEFRTGINYNF